MARTKTNPKWKARAFAIYHNAGQPKPGRKRVADQLARDYPDATDAPSERVIGNFLTEYRNELSDEDKREYEYFAWPASMEAGLLPWEASRALLDLTRQQGRILIPFARWYWRVCQAMPDASISERTAVAGTLAVRTLISPSRSEEAALQAYLAYAPWRPDEAKKAYEKAVEAKRIEYWDGGAIRLDSLVEDVDDALSLRMGQVFRGVGEVIGKQQQAREEKEDGE